MKSFAVKRDEKDPRWEKFKSWYDEKMTELGFTTPKAEWEYYGIDNCGHYTFSDFPGYFDRILTLDEWEEEFVQPKLAGREYDESLFRDWLNSPGVVVSEENIMSNGLTKGFNEFLHHRYAKPDRISEIKAEIEKLSNELKELEG